MAKRLTAITIENMKADASRLEVPAGNGLYVTVQPSGRKGFCVRYRFNGVPRKLTLPSGVTLAQARKLAADAMFEVARGNDPGEAKKIAQRKATAAAVDTVEAICREYIKREHGKLRTARQREQLLERHVYPALGDRQIDGVRRSELVRLLDKIEDNAGARSADVVLGILRKIFNWHARRSDTFKTPVVAGMARHPTGKHARSRVLSDDELRKLWHATETPTPYNALVRFLLLTGARRGEAIGLTRDEITDGVWTLPARRNKTAQELRRPLSRAALALLDAQPHIAGCPYIFSHGRRMLGGLSKAKAKLDAASGVVGWVVHDLRRSSRTLLARAGVSDRVAEQCLGHKIRGIEATYNKHSYQEEMRHAYEALAALIERTIDPKENVVALLRR